MMYSIYNITYPVDKKGNPIDEIVYIINGRYN